MGDCYFVSARSVAWIRYLQPLPRRFSTLRSPHTLTNTIYSTVSLLYSDHHRLPCRGIPHTLAKMDRNCNPADDSTKQYGFFGFWGDSLAADVLKANGDPFRSKLQAGTCYVREVAVLMLMNSL